MSEMAEKVIQGDAKAVARLIRYIDDGMPEAKEILKTLYPHTGKAYVIGITGAPGVGKSTLVDQMIRHLRRQSKTVGVLAIDPTSPFSGGAVLGDRIRMQQHSLDQDVFIRSLATRGHFGGLTQSTRSVIEVLDAMGKDYILVETVGVGQDEVDVVKSAHTTVIVVIPGMGDDVQAIKAGILETGDIFVVNKAEREGTDKTLNDLKLMIGMDPKKHALGEWMPPVLKTEAVLDQGVDDLLVEIERHRTHIDQLNGKMQYRERKEHVRQELTDLVKSRLMEEVLEEITQSDVFEHAVRSVMNGDQDPYTACDNFVISGNCI